MKILFASACVMLLSACGVRVENAAINEATEVVEFHIKAGTGDKAWNSAEEEVVVKVGQTLRIINDDHVAHRLHTNGKPCPHGPAMAAQGGFYDCVVAKAYDWQVDGVLYEHDVGSMAPFYLRTTSNEDLGF